MLGNFTYTFFSENLFSLCYAANRNATSFWGGCDNRAEEPVDIPNVSKIASLYAFIVEPFLRNLKLPSLV